MTKLKFAFFGASFWAHYQLAAWKELAGAECVAICNRTRARGEKLAREFGVPAVYDDPAELFAKERLDFVDVCTYPYSFRDLIRVIAPHRVPIITQKPMAPSLAIAEENMRVCREAGIPYLIHENWRWQAQLRELKHVLDRGEIGTPFRARISLVSGFPVFINEPQIAELEDFILTDLGTHLLDLARFYFGEAQSLYCQIHRVHPDIKGEDVATVMLAMGAKTTVTCELGYAENPIEHEYFPQTMVFVEGDRGTAEIAKDYWLRVTTKTGTHARRFPPTPYAWVDPNYHLIHSSIVPCHANLLSALRGEGVAETTAADNYQTLRLVYAAYDSARNKRAVHLSQFAKNA